MLINFAFGIAGLLERVLARPTPFLYNGSFYAEDDDGCFGPYGSALGDRRDDESVD